MDRNKCADGIRVSALSGVGGCLFCVLSAVDNSNNNNNNSNI